VTINSNEVLRSVTGITEVEKQRIQDFLHGSVYCWCINRENEWFSLRDLMGGGNSYWKGTPMLSLYLKHEGKSNEPTIAAGKDAGWLLKSVIMSDKRKFETKKEDFIRKYKWIDDGK